jgi:predicted NAD/FAD-binding protein
MTFGITRDQGAFEWAGTSLSAVFAQRPNIFSPRMWLMLFDVVRFNQYALDVLRGDTESDVDPSDGVKPDNMPQGHQESIGSYLKRNNYSAAFQDDYLIPMTACVWSTSPDKCSLDFPAVTLIRFLWNHHLLSTISARPQWMTIKEGSQLYIDAIMKNHPKSRTHLNQGVKSLKKTLSGQAELQFFDGSTELFDHVILATHGDQAMDIMRETANDEEASILSSFKTSKNTTILHSDLSLMPKNTIAWSAWNYITKTPQSKEDEPQVCLTYWMNLLQHIPTSKFGHVLVTLNPLHRPDPKTIQGEWTYHHPLYNAAAIRAQSLLPRIQNTAGVSYTGAWTKYGFHEDGFSSGLKVAMDHLGAEIPFQFIDSTFSRGRQPVLQWKDYLARIIISAIYILMLSVSVFVDRSRIWRNSLRSEVKRLKVS